MAPWWSAGLTTPQGRSVPFAGRRRVGCRTSARWGAMRARLGAFPPMAPWWSAPGSQRRRAVACLSLDGGGWDAGPRHAGRRWSEAWGVSADGSVVVGWAENAAGQWRAFRWTAAGGMEDLNITYAHLLTDGSELYRSVRHLPRWALYCGAGLQRRHRAPRSLPAGHSRDLALRSGRGQQGYGCACCRSRRTSAWCWSLRLPKQQAG
jgi:probable HAF family extracellular repeat protein